MAPLVEDPMGIRIAMVGMVEENRHPYSWCAVFNGFDPKAMADCPEPGIVEYLNAEPPENLGITGARVTHIWCDDPLAARHVAQASLVPNVVQRPQDVIGQVDAVIIPTDIGSEHLERVRPFIQAGLPLFIDKPLTDSGDHLRQFVRWQSEGNAIMSSSALRYSIEFEDCRRRMSEVGEPRLITVTSVKSWERYGIHAAEAAYPFLEPGGWVSVANTGVGQSNVVHAHHASGVEVLLTVIDDMHGSFGSLSLYGTKSSIHTRFADRFSALKRQLLAFVEYLRSGHPHFAFSETIELMKIIIAGKMSKEQSGRRVLLSEIEV